MIAALEKDPQSPLFVVLLICWAVLLFGGFFLGKLNAEGTHRTPRWARIASSFVLVAVAWSAYGILENNLEAARPVLLALNGSMLPVLFLIAAGMTLGFTGDLFMANLIPIKEPVLGSIAAFALGHIAYIVALVHYGDILNLSAAAPRWGALVFWWTMGVGGWYIVVYRGHKVTPLHYAALGYSLLLATTAGFATGLALQWTIFIPLALGAILFLLSDLLLAAQLFSNLHFVLIGDIVWLLYGPGQMLVVYSIIAVQRYWFR